MGDTLDFDEDGARQEEAIFETPAAAERRQFARELLGLRPGEAVLSVGCGPGFEPAELAPVVGDDGRVHGIDRSEAMLALAERRCENLPQVTLAEADAADLPVADESFDAAVAVQVYEYLDAVDPALDELHRVLRPGGRAVVCDADFDALVWRSTDDERTTRVLDAYDDHCAHPRLGSRLAPRLREADLTVERVESNSILNTSLDEDAFAFHLMHSVVEYVADHDEVGPDEAAAWVEDLRRLDDRGGTFFDYTQYAYLVRKPE